MVKLGVVLGALEVFFIISMLLLNGIATAEEFHSSSNDDQETILFQDDSSPVDSVDSTSDARAKLPNIVVMLVDDLGYGDLGYSGHPTSLTPVIDRLAARSKVFTQYYVTSPVCSPSRASMLTGRYQMRSGVYPSTFAPENYYGLPTNETTIAELLKTKGYRTLITGKWHLGVGINREYLPAYHGFDDFLGLPYSHDMCPCMVCFDNDKPCYDTCSETRVTCALFSNTSIVEQPVYLPSVTQRLVDKAKQFVQESVLADTPFFLYIPFLHVHHPQFSAPAHEGKSSRGTFGDSLLELDDSVDQVVKQLQELGIDNNTILWFASDNGPSLRRHERGGCAGPLRCGKGTAWEGGVRVPAFVSWPGKIQPERSGGLLSAMDLLPTLAAITGADTANLTLDGMDVSQLLLQAGDQSPREFFAVYPENPKQDTGVHAVVYGRYKAHFYTIGSLISDNDNYDPVCGESHPLTLHDPPLLFDLAVDPGERWNIANDTQYESILGSIIAWRTEHMAEMTWSTPLTEATDYRAQPCCTESTCEPYPDCCNCPLEHSVLSSLIYGEL